MEANGHDSPNFDRKLRTGGITSDILQDHRNELRSSFNNVRSVKRSWLLHDLNMATCREWRNYNTDQR